MNRNVLFVCLDTVRADLFEQAAAETPGMADVVAAGARAPSSCTVSSHASLVSGQLPSDHGVYSFDTDMRRLDASETLFDSLSDYRTVGVSANPYAGSASHFDTFFDEFVDISPQRRFPDGMDAGTDVFDISVETADRRFDTEGGVGTGVDEATQERLEQLGYN